MFVVAGVSGHVGSVVAETLLAGKHAVKVIVRDAGKGASWSKKGAEVAVADLGDAAALTTALKGASGFFALLPPPHGASDIYASQRAVADSIAQAVKASGVKHVVMLSSIGADLDHSNGPIKGLHYLEKKLGETGTTLTAIRAGSFQENVAGAVGPAKAIGTYFNFYPSADYPAPMIATRDIGALAAEELAKGASRAEIIDLHGPSYSQRQVAEILGKALGKTLNIVDIPRAGWLDAMLQGGLPRPLAESYVEMYDGFGKGLLTPKGDRQAQGHTTLDTVIARLV